MDSSTACYVCHELRSRYGYQQVIHLSGGLGVQVREESASRNDAVDNPSRRKNSVDVSKVLEPLEGECATVSHLFWSYKWCHRGRITQASSWPQSSSKRLEALHHGAIEGSPNRNSSIVTPQTWNPRYFLSWSKPIPVSWGRFLGQNGIPWS